MKVADRCSFRWRAGLFPLIGSPPDGARCTGEVGHAGEHSFSAEIDKRSDIEVRILNSRREALRIALVLENKFAGSSCENIETTSTTIVYEHGGRVFHLVVHDMGPVTP